MATLYVFDELSDEDRRLFEKEMVKDQALQAEVEELRSILAQMEIWKVDPPASGKTRFLTAIDKLIAEEAASSDPKILTEASKAADYKYWLDLPAFKDPDKVDNIHYLPISQTEIGGTAVVWLTGVVPEEVHHDALEKFLVIEGSCDIEYNGQVHSLKAGDFLSIPLHHNHLVTVTSEIPCKLILQRIAA